ncbi:MAG: hypothetical protein WC836_14750 [Desulfobacula sp.]|jgi:hypothetical protein
MTRLFDLSQRKTYPAGCAQNADLVAEYRRSDRRERDIMWMKYRELRQCFDEIEKTRSGMAASNSFLP